MPRRIAVIFLAVAAAVLTGCGARSTGTGSAPETHTDELDAAGGRPCPQELPVGEDPSGHGFGVEEEADETPDLYPSDRAWVCRYDTFDAGTTPEGGAVYGWRLVGRPDPVAAAALPDLDAALGDLAPADRRGGCNSDLGSRWMVVSSRAGDLTGLVVDDYGCRDGRLTADPHTTPPGEEGAGGTVRGVLDGGPAVLSELGVGRTD